MSEGVPSTSNFDPNSLSSLFDRVVASNLTGAIYTRLHTLQTQDDYDTNDFEAVARDVVREVMHTYSALLTVFHSSHSEASDPDNSDNLNDFDDLDDLSNLGNLEGDGL